MSVNLLCVDEMGITKLELSGILRGLDINILTVKDASEALNVLKDKADSIGAITWTINSIDFNCFDVLANIKNKDEYKNIPIIIISKFTDKKYIIRAIQAGATEFIAKPYDEVTVVKKICNILRIQVDNTHDKKDEEDIIILNFSEMFNREIKAASRGNYPLSIMLVSPVRNDTEEKEPEDLKDIVSLFNRVIKTRLRETDTSFLYGSENIIILLPFADKKGAETVEKKVCSTFATHSMMKRKNKGYYLITSSVSMPEDGKIKGKLLEKLEKNFLENINSQNNIVS